MPQPKKGLLDKVVKTVAKKADKALTKSYANQAKRQETKKKVATAVSNKAEDMLQNSYKKQIAKKKAKQAKVTEKAKEKEATAMAKSLRATMPNAIDRSGQNVKVVSGNNMARVSADQLNRGTVRGYRKADAKVEKRALKAANKKKK